MDAALRYDKSLRNDDVVIRRKGQLFEVACIGRTADLVAEFDTAEAAVAGVRALLKED